VEGGTNLQGMAAMSLPSTTFSPWRYAGLAKLLTRIKSLVMLPLAPGTWHNCGSGTSSQLLIEGAGSCQIFGEIADSGWNVGSLIWGTYCFLQFQESARNCQALYG